MMLRVVLDNTLEKLIRKEYKNQRASVCIDAFIGKALRHFLVGKELSTFDVGDWVGLSEISKVVHTSPPVAKKLLKKLIKCGKIKKGDISLLAKEHNVVIKVFRGVADEVIELLTEELSKMGKGGKRKVKEGCHGVRGKCHNRNVVKKVRNKSIVGEVSYDNKIRQDEQRTT